MEFNSIANIEINLYDDLLKFNELSPEERMAATPSGVAESTSGEQQLVADIAEPFKETSSESGEFNFIMSDSTQAADSVETPESNDMIFMLSEPEAQATDNSGSDEAGGLLLSYQDVSADAMPESISSSEFTEEPENLQPVSIAEGFAPDADIKETVTPVVNTLTEEIHHDSFALSEPVAEPVVTLQEEQQTFSAPAYTETVIEETKTPAARTTDKQGVRITVREETAGSVTLSVADILGEDDFDDEPTGMAEQVSKQPDPLPVIEPDIVPVAAAESEITSSESESVSASEPLRITDFLFTAVEDVDEVAEASAVDETPVTQPLNSLADSASVSYETMASEDFHQITASLIQPGQDASQIEEMLKVSRPLKITGFLSDPYKSDEADEPQEITCPECGHLSKATDLLCLGCGAFFENPEDDVEKELACVDCGENVAADEVFCPACGSILLAH